jgi:predicted aldo/keto reductase-like oxidoreductase
MGDFFKAAYDSGITFFDSADQYGTHPHVREGLKRVPREKVQILTKTHASTEKEMRADLDRFRRELNTDYVDILLLHCMLDKDWPERKKGAIVKTHGTSCHTLDALKTAAATDWVQVDLVRFNPVGKEAAMDADPQTVLGVMREMKAKGKGLIGMKVLGAGKLRSRADEAIQFHIAHSEIDCFTIGCESIPEMQDTIRKISAASTRG